MKVTYIGRHLMLRKEYLDKVLSKSTFRTIRLGIVKPKYREVFIHSNGMVVAKAEIINVNYKKVKELTDLDAKLDNFNNKQELIKELKKIYGKIRKQKSQLKSVISIMAKILPKRRKFEIKKKRKRREKLKKLRGLYSQAKGEKEKEKIFEKALKISPWLTKEEFLAPLKKKKED